MEGMLDTAIRLPLVAHMSGRTSRCNDTEVPYVGRQLSRALRCTPPVNLGNPNWQSNVHYREDGRERLGREGLFRRIGADGQDGWTTQTGLWNPELTPNQSTRLAIRVPPDAPGRLDRFPCAVGSETQLPRGTSGKDWSGARWSIRSTSALAEPCSSTAWWITQTRAGSAQKSPQTHRIPAPICWSAKGASDTPGMWS